MLPSYKTFYLIVLDSSEGMLLELPHVVIDLYILLKLIQNRLRDWIPLTVSESNQLSSIIFFWQWFDATEGHRWGSHRICGEKSASEVDQGSNVVSHMFKIQNRRAKAARDLEWSSQGYPFEHSIQPFLSNSTTSLPFPWSFLWIPSSTGTYHPNIWTDNFLIVVSKLNLNNS